MMREKTILLFSAILFLTLIPGIHHGLWRPNEPQVAGVCAEMAYQKDFVVPHLNGQPFLGKRPLDYALGALSDTLFGKACFQQANTLRPHFYLGLLHKKWQPTKECNLIEQKLRVE
jgi:4-amino-4-deoxy-L-arabinose transferase-like glycosyltransferase